MFLIALDTGSIPVDHPPWRMTIKAWPARPLSGVGLPSARQRGSYRLQAS
jgi:hypothetical protein